MDRMCYVLCMHVLCIVTILRQRALIFLNGVLTILIFNMPAILECATDSQPKAVYVISRRTSIRYATASVRAMPISYATAVWAAGKAAPLDWHDGFGLVQNDYKMSKS